MSMRSKLHFLQNLGQSRWISTLKSATIQSMMAPNKQSVGMSWEHRKDLAWSKSWIARYCQCDWRDQSRHHPAIVQWLKNKTECAMLWWLNDDIVCHALLFCQLRNQYWVVCRQMSKTIRLMLPCDTPWFFYDDFNNFQHAKHTL